MYMTELKFTYSNKVYMNFIARMKYESIWQKWEALVMNEQWTCITNDVHTRINVETPVEQNKKHASKRNQKQGSKLC